MPTRGSSVKRKHAQGAILLDVLIGIFMFFIAAMSYFAIFPTIRKSELIGRQKAVAVQMSTRMLEHLQMLRPTDLNEPTLQQLGLIDDVQESPGQFTFSHIPLDEGSGYSPSKVLKNGHAGFTVTELSHGSKRIDLWIGWTSPNGNPTSITTGTIIGGFR